MNSKQRQAVSAAAKKSKLALAQKVGKKNRTLSLNEGVYIALAKYCAAKDLTVSEVVDELMSAFMREVE